MPSPSLSAGVDETTQEPVAAEVMLVPIGVTDVDRVRALTAASTSSRTVKPMSPVISSAALGVVRLPSPHPAAAAALSARANRRARLHRGDIPCSPSIYR